MSEFYQTSDGMVERERKRAVGRDAKARQVYSTASREKMRQAKLGKPQMPRTPEWAAKISAAQKGKLRGPMSPEHKAAHAAAVASPPARTKMSASATARFTRRSILTVVELIQVNERLSCV